MASIVDLPLEGPREPTRAAQEAGVAPDDKVRPIPTTQPTEVPKSRRRDGRGDVLRPESADHGVQDSTVRAATAPADVTAAVISVRALVRLALAPAQPGAYAFAHRRADGGVELGYLSINNANEKYRAGRGRCPVLTGNSLATSLAAPTAEAADLIVIVERFYTDDDAYVPPWVTALTASARMASITDVQIDELDETAGIPTAIAGTKDGDEMMIEIVFDRTGIKVDRHDHALARAVTLLLVEEDLRGLDQPVDLSTILEDEESLPVTRATAVLQPSVDQALDEPSQQERLLTREMLREIVPISDMGLWRWLRKGTFPQPLKFNGRNYWRASEVQSWIDARAATRR